MESLELLLNLMDLLWLGVVKDKREKLIGCMLLSQSVGVSFVLTKYDFILLLLVKVSVGVGDKGTDT